MTSSTPTVISFGEVLWDIFPEARRIGGAPLNVAYHLNKLGVNATLISRIGRDENGKGIRDFLAEKIPGKYLLQEDSDHPTGTVEIVSHHALDVSYDIVKDVAWDYIEYDNPVDELTSHADYLIFGSLAARSPTSRETLDHLLGKIPLKVFDINLREPFYTKEDIEEFLKRSAIVKMNERELKILSGWFSFSGDLREQMKTLVVRFELETLIVTAGPGGAYAASRGQLFFEPGRKVKVMDTVGSGDAFLAGFLSEYISAKSVPQALKTANALGALIAGKRGGCPEYDANSL